MSKIRDVGGYDSHLFVSYLIESIVSFAPESMMAEINKNETARKEQSRFGIFGTNDDERIVKLSADPCRREHRRPWGRGSSWSWP